MNKEVKAIIEYLNEEKEAIRKGFYYPNDVLSYEDLTMIIDYINQLETNRDEAIDFIKKTQFDCGEFNCCGFGIWKDGRNELLEILERGKEC